MEELSLEEKIAQMFLIELQEKEITQATIDMIQKYKIGGIILYRRNYKSYKELINLVNKLKELNKQNKIPLFISIDQEGGRVNRMPSEIKNLRSASNIASFEDVEVVKESGKIISKMLLNLGINLNFAPVLDIKRFEDGHAIGDRCYGKNKEEVEKYAIEAMKEMKKQGLLTTIKHFPGHGATQKDSHFILPIIKKNKQELENDDMEPFKKAIEQGADGVMVGHVAARCIDKFHPASLSRIVIQKYLRRKCKFKGLIVTDDLKMKSITLLYTPKKATKLAINAGNNMIMLGFKYNQIIHIINETAHEVKKGRIRIWRIDRSVQKIIDIKKKYNVNDNKPNGLNIEEINKEIEQINNGKIWNAS